jgi:hypothetical protein
MVFQVFQQSLELPILMVYVFIQDGLSLTVSKANRFGVANRVIGVVLGDLYQPSKHTTFLRCAPLGTVHESWPFTRLEQF